MGKETSNGVEVWHGLCDKTLVGHGPWVRKADHDAIAAAWKASAEGVQEHFKILTARVTEAENRAYRLAVAIIGGEDAPGYADSIDTEILENMAREAANDGRNFYSAVLAERSASIADLRQRIADLEAGDGEMTRAKANVRRKAKTPTMLAPECELGRAAIRYRQKLGAGVPTYMRLTGDGCIAFGWREDLPVGTQQAHFTDAAGNYDCGEVKVSIVKIVSEVSQ